MDFMVKILEDVDIASKQQAEKTKKRKAALENKGKKKLTKLQIAASSIPKITTFFSKKEVQVPEEQTEPMDFEELENNMEWGGYSLYKLDYDS